MLDKNRLRFGSIGDRSLHLCVDMQRLFAENTPWRTPWMNRVVPNVLRLVQTAPEATMFTRFIPAEKVGVGQGTWKRYYERWSSMTIERLGRDMVELIPALHRFVPPAELLDKRVYSPWVETDLQERLLRRKIDTIIVSGGETDVCVLSTVLGAIDRGYRVIIATDALCSSSDETHDAQLGIYHRRYGQQVETVKTQLIINHWRSQD